MVALRVVCLDQKGQKLSESIPEPTELVPLECQINRVDVTENRGTASPGCPKRGGRGECGEYLAVSMPRNVMVL